MDHIVYEIMVVFVKALSKLHQTSLGQEFSCCSTHVTRRFGPDSIFEAFYAYIRVTLKDIQDWQDNIMNIALLRLRLSIF